MGESLVPTAHTVASAADVYASLRAAWQSILGTTPARASLLVLLSQWSLETGGGGSCNNWNLAGIKHTDGDGHDFAEYLTTERLSRTTAMALVTTGTATVVKDDGATIVVKLPQKFRAYASLNEAAIDYLQELRHQFGFAWPAVEAGDVLDFAHRLKLRGYYTATEADYAAGLKARYAQLDHVIPSEPQSVANVQPLFVPPDPTPDTEPPDEVA